MPNDHERYIYLFAKTADAVEAIEAMNFGQAREILIAAQRECEEMYLSSGKKTADTLSDA